MTTGASVRSKLADDAATRGATFGHAVAAGLHVALQDLQGQRAVDLRVGAGGDGALAAFVDGGDLCDDQHREQADHHADHQLDQRDAALGGRGSGRHGHVARVRAGRDLR